MFGIDGEEIYFFISRVLIAGSSVMGMAIIFQVKFDDPEIGAFLMTLLSYHLLTYRYLGDTMFEVGSLQKQDAWFGVIARIFISLLAAFIAGYILNTIIGYSPKITNALVMLFIVGCCIYQKLIATLPSPND